MSTGQDSGEFFNNGIGPVPRNAKEATPTGDDVFRLGVYWSDVCAVCIFTLGRLLARPFAFKLVYLDENPVASNSCIALANVGTSQWRARSAKVLFALNLKGIGVFQCFLAKQSTEGYKRLWGRAFR